MSTLQLFGLALNEQRPGSSRFLSRLSREKDCQDRSGIISDLPCGSRLSWYLVAWTCKLLRQYVTALHITDSGSMSRHFSQFHKHYEHMPLANKRPSIHNTEFRWRRSSV